MAEFLRAEKLCKRFPGVVANDGIDFSVDEGEVRVVLGENGAGKSVLMSMLYGIYQPDGGRILVRGSEVRMASPRVAISHGIGMVHQHFMLVPGFTVAENVVLGYDPVRRWFRPGPRAEAEVRALAEHYGFEVDPAADVSRLSVGLRQRVEILKVLFRRAKCIILDEPTAVLTPQEVDQLARNVRGLATDGFTVIIITHKLDEVAAFGDRVTVMRAGTVVATVPVKETDKMLLARMMVGREVAFQVRKPPFSPGPPVLEVENLLVPGDRGVMAVNGVSFCVRAGEILGIAGVDGNGQRELAQAIYGLRRPVSGTIRFLARDTTNLPTRQLQRLGMRSVPPDRGTAGLIGEFDLAENLVLEDVSTARFSRLGIIRDRLVRDNGERLLREFSVRASSMRAEASHLSGGNQQKVVLARAISAEPKLLIVSQPTRGLDVGATEYVHQRLVACRSAGAAILLVSTDLDEILSLSDRVAVMLRGKIMGILDADLATRAEVGALMGGVRVTGDAA